MGLFINIIVFIAGIAAVIGAVSMIFQQNPVRAALGLLVSLSAVGIIFLAIGAHFVGFVQFMIYAGAIVILFLFAIMNFPVGRLRRDRIPATRLVGMLLIIILAVILFSDLVMIAGTGALNAPFAARHLDDALKIGQRFVFQWAYPFELIGVLLLVAVIASIHLTRGMGRKKEGDSK